MNEGTKTSTGLDIWAILELMGHQRMAGKLTEVTVAGHGFLRIDVPATESVPAFTRLVSPASVCAMQRANLAVASRWLGEEPVE